MFCNRSWESAGLRACVAQFRREAMPPKKETVKARGRGHGWKHVAKKVRAWQMGTKS